MQPSLPGILVKCWYGTRNKKVLEDYEGLAIYKKLLQSKTWNFKASFQAKKDEYEPIVQRRKARLRLRTSLHEDLAEDRGRFALTPKLTPTLSSKLQEVLCLRGQSRVLNAQFVLLSPA